MTVRELKETLDSFNDDAKVAVIVYESSYTYHITLDDSMFELVDSLLDDDNLVLAIEIDYDRMIKEE